MGSTGEESNPSLETQNDIHLGISSNGTNHDVDEDDDDDDQNQIQNQPTEEEVLAQEFQTLVLQANDGGTQVEEEEEKEDEETHPYPLRPSSVDCTFYLKTGTCKFGLNCRFNHPSNRVFQPVGEKEKAIEERNGSVVDTGKIDCKYFQTPGGCKYGDACRYNHSKGKKEKEEPELNFLGLPIRPSEKECTFYMRNGSCAYGANCRFHHPDPTATKEAEPENSYSQADGKYGRGDTHFPKTYVSQPVHFSGASQATLPDLSNGINLKKVGLPYAPVMGTYHQPMPQSPEWNQNQVPVTLSAAKTLLPHQVVNFPKKAVDPLTHYERLMQIEEFPERPGQPDCDYFLKTGDCKYRSNCRYNHPVTRAPKLRLPPLSTKVPYSRTAAVLPVQSKLPNSNPRYTRNNGMSSDHHHQQQQTENGEFPERPGQPDCEYFLKTGNCKFRSACRYNHPSNRMSSVSCPLNQKGLPLRPGSKICRNYEEQGTCKYGRSCHYHHPDDENSSPDIAPDAPVAAQEQSSTAAAGAADLVSPATASNNAESDWGTQATTSNNADSDWGDGWVL